MTKPRILVLGDAMLDLRTEGTATRLSPEAPVPVLRIGPGASVPSLGGAANVAANVVSLGGAACLIAVVGQDDAAKTMEGLAKQAGVRTRFSVDPDRQTTQKHRFVTGDRHLLRVDAESDLPPPEAIQNFLLMRYSAALDRVNTVVLSDYAKGVLAPPVLGSAITMAKERSVPVIVDPKRYPLIAYRGATAITPNIQEAITLSGVGDVHTDAGAAAAGMALLMRGDFRAVVITRSEKGVTLTERLGTGGKHLHVTHHPSLARHVIDVTGAGDSFVAAFALELARGSSYKEAVRQGQEAAAIAVGRFGTVAVNLDREPETFDDVIKAWKRDGLRVGFTNGCFDILHTGHLHLLRTARSMCDRLVVGINDDESVGRMGKSHPLIQSINDRLAILSSLKFVDAVTVFPEDTPLSLIRSIKPDVIFRGDDGVEVIGADLVGSVVRVPLLTGRSTTETWRRATERTEAA